MHKLIYSINMLFVILLSGWIYLLSGSICNMDSQIKMDIAFMESRLVQIEGKLDAVLKLRVDTLMELNKVMED